MLWRCNVWFKIQFNYIPSLFKYENNCLTCRKKDVLNFFGKLIISESTIMKKFSLIFWAKFHRNLWTTEVTWQSFSIKLLPLLTLLRWINILYKNSVRRKVYAKFLLSQISWLKLAVFVTINCWKLSDDILKCVKKKIFNAIIYHFPNQIIFHGLIVKTTWRH